MAKYRQALQTLSGIIVFLFVLNACQKSNDTPGQQSPPIPTDSTAIFTFDCSSVSVNGSYFPSNELSVEDSLVIKVNVQQEGYYKLASDTVNGIYFIDSTIYLNTGDQTLTLTGFGTPVKEGQYSFTLHGPGVNCGFTLQVTIPVTLVSKVIHQNYGITNEFTYNSDKLPISIIDPFFNYGHDYSGYRMMAYYPDKKLKTVTYGIPPGTAVDSFVYAADGRLQYIFKGNNVVDTFVYNSQGFLESEHTADHRNEFTFNADSNLTSVTMYWNDKPRSKYEYGGYDKNINPLYNIGNAHYYFGTIFRFSHNNVDLSNFMQLSKHNPGWITVYVRTDVNTWYADETDNLSYSYNSEGYPTDVLYYGMDLINRFIYVKK